LVLDEHADRLRVLEHVGCLPGRAARIDGRRDRADAGESEVEERPLEARAADDPEGIALADPAGQQAVRELIDRLCGLVPGNLAPAPWLGLDEVGGACAVRADRVTPEPRNRPLFHVEDFMAGIAAVSAKALHPITLRWLPQ